ncbi:1-phosphofructokinase [Allofournierella sp.]|uniref:1-phosphofructokinase n=1 Tax=Allofournierella sp. TaxID=1940256 RepID=UPI003AB8F00A
MITTVTLNASIDKLYLLENWQPGRVNRVEQCRASAGGKGVNAARVLQLLGAPVRATGFLGGHSGAYLLELLRKDGVEGDFYAVEGESRSCVNLIDAQGRGTEFLEPGPQIPAAAQAAFCEKLRLMAKEGPVALCGSLPAGCAPDYYARLIRAVRAAGAPVLLDSSGQALARGLGARPDLIKPNREELAQLTGCACGSLEQVRAAAVGLRGQGAASVAVSLGEGGALLACPEGVFWGAAPSVPVQNATGCGDSMVAAFALAIREGRPGPEQLRFALAVAGANAMQQRTGFVEPADVAALLPRCRVERLGA